MEPKLTKGPGVSLKNKPNFIQWLKLNLFNSWFNTLLTLLSLVVIVSVLTGVITWGVGANWSVISANFKLLIIGQYPVAHLWRAWVSLLVLMFLLGLSYGLYRNNILKVVFYFIATLVALHVVLPFITIGSKGWLVGAITTLFIGMFMGRRFPSLKKFSIVGWLLLYPVVIFFLNGFGILPTVKTNAWGGFTLNIIIASSAIVFSFPLGVLLALGRASKLPVIRSVCIFYIELIRGVPLISLLIVAMLVIPLFLPAGITIDSILRVTIAVTLFNAAYIAENVRGGLQSIPKSQYEAADALGLNVWKRTAFIILPQALRVTVPSMVGQSISIFKDTTLVAIVGVVDLLGIGRAVMANPEFLGTQKEIYVFVAFVFWLFCYLMSITSKQIEKSLKTSHS
ncbi:amino acid ABC transporter permease protein [Bacillus sp. TS-2]|nr:amino acid ABC transporter permease protein [Bacillus sp. TS-2]